MKPYAVYSDHGYLLGRFEHYAEAGAAFKRWRQARFVLGWHTSGKNKPPAIVISRGRRKLELMSAAIIKESLARRPFEPFRVRLSSGDAYEVRHPENALLVRSGLCLSVPDDTGELPEVPLWCSYLHIAAVEPLTVGKKR